MICVAWVGMGSYAQCALTQFIKDSTEPVTLIAIASDVPKICKTELAGSKVIWVDTNDQRPIVELVGEMPRVFVEGGWFLPILRRYMDEVKAGGGHIIGMMDNTMMSGLKLRLWALNFRLRYKRYYEGFVAAGESTRKLLKYCGFTDEHISVGNYPCDLSIFTDGAPITERPKRIVYVGRYIEIKNIKRFLGAYLKFSASHQDWVFELYGQGPLEDELKRMTAGSKSVIMHPFATPQELATVYKESRVLVLPSFSDHWGVVVQESAASGCAQISSTGVRAADAFCSEKNGFVVDPMSEAEMGDALEKLDSWTDEQWCAAQKESVRLAQTLTPHTFSDGLHRIIGAL